MVRNSALSYSYTFRDSAANKFFFSRNRTNPISTFTVQKLNRAEEPFPNLPEIHDFVYLSVIILNNPMRDSALRSVLPDLS